MLSVILLDVFMLKVIYNEMLRVFMLKVIYTECRYAESFYAGCPDASKRAYL
jgi:hypothetical protein